MFGRIIAAQIIFVLGLIGSVLIGLGMWKNGAEVADAVFMGASVWGAALTIALLLFASSAYKMFKDFKVFK